jgi:hypothetical protein
MQDLINKINWDSVKFTSQILVCLVLIWMAVLYCAISSIRSHPYSRSQRAFWIAVVTLLPVLGLLVYLPFSLRSDEALLQLFFWRRGKK